MTPGVQALLSGALTFGVPLLFAARELIVLRRPDGGAGGLDRPRDPAPVPPPPGNEPHSRPLPACLIAAAQVDAIAQPADRRRVLEPV